MTDKITDVYINKNDETQLATPEENYFSRSKNQWLLVSDMSDMHVRRAFKRLLRMIRLGQLIEIDDLNKDSFAKANIQNELNNIKTHILKVEEIIND
jgi:hypothetical protein